MRKSIISSSSSQTQNIAAALAKTILETKPAKSARVLALTGELGSGKTTFVQGLAKGFGVKEKILSPTFILIRCHKLQTENYRLFYHVDCYRLDNPTQELLHLGFKKIVADPRHIVAIEWADRIKKILPKDSLWASFSHGGKSLTRRTIAIG